MLLATLHAALPRWDLGGSPHGSSRQPSTLSSVSPFYPWQLLHQSGSPHVAVLETDTRLNTLKLMRQKPKLIHGPPPFIGVSKFLHLNI